jgi:hypothetical protein
MEYSTGTIVQETVHCPVNTVRYGKGAPIPSENIKDNMRTITILADNGHYRLYINKGALALLGVSEYYKFQFSKAGRDTILTISMATADEPGAFKAYFGKYRIAMWQKQIVKKILDLAAGSTDRMKFKVEGTGIPNTIRVNLSRGHLPMSPYKPNKKKEKVEACTQVGTEIKAEITQKATRIAKKVIKRKVSTKVDKTSLVSITTPLGLRTFEDPKQAIKWLNDFIKVAQR